MEFAPLLPERPYMAFCNNIYLIWVVHTYKKSSFMLVYDFRTSPVCVFAHSTK